MHHRCIVAAINCSSMYKLFYACATSKAVHNVPQGAGGREMSRGG